ncbi:MAG: DUF6056 family protein [Desulfovibrio sp.]|nr:DUF6056 family protein [Desulfovibrio sp.]
MLKSRTLFSLGCACTLIWLLMFSLSAMTPFMTDNYLFSRAMTPGYAAFMSGASIDRLDPMSWKAAVDQSLLMYTTWCGRFFGNFFVYVSFMLPGLLRAALSSALFVGLCLLVHVHVFGKAWLEQLSAKALLLPAALLWAGMPSFGSAFFWVSVGGLPAILAQLLFLLPYRFALDHPDNLEKSSYSFSVFFFLFGLITANLDYASSAAMPVAACAACCWLFFRQKRRPRKMAFWSLAGFLGVSLGAAITLLAPGNAERLRLTTDAEVHAWLASSFFERILDYCLNLPRALLLQGVPLLLLLWAFCALRQCHGSKWWQAIPIPCVFFLVPFAATHAAYFFTCWPPARAFATTTVQLTLAASIAAYAAQRSTAYQRASCLHRLFQALGLALCLYCALTIPVECGKFYQLHQAIAAREAVFVSHRGEDVRVPALPVEGDRYLVLNYHLQDIFYDPGHWVNRAVAAYWGLKSVALREERWPKLSAQLSDSSGNPCQLVCQRSKDRLKLELFVRSQVSPPYQQLCGYYYGRPGLVSLLPGFLADSLAERFRENSNFWSTFVPLLFARFDATLSWQSQADGSFLAQAEAPLWGIYTLPCAPFWLVQPGQSKYSFALVPLTESLP